VTITVIRSGRIGPGAVADVVVADSRSSPAAALEARPRLAASAPDQCSSAA
jgi:hypothetical protein